MTRRELTRGGALLHSVLRAGGRQGRRGLRRVPTTPLFTTSMAPGKVVLLRALLQEDPWTGEPLVELRGRRWRR